MKKICIMTGTRAEYGLLKPLIELVHKSEETELQLVVTGMHLSPEFGLTYKEIEQDRYPVSCKVEMLLSSDTTVGITKSIGIGLIGFADCFERLKPDIVIILGDRYEMLAVAAAALIARIPIAHIHGGELTEGLIDEAIRHSISKMSQLHFVTTEEYRKRVIQLGEQPERVKNVGALGVENAKNVSLLSKEKLEKQLGILFRNPTVLVTYHPVTLEEGTSENKFSNILEVLEEKEELFIIFTKANSDTEGRVINRMIDEFASRYPERCRVYTSLGQKGYLSTLQYCDLVLGNSSSGIIEVPSFKIPTIDIGDRQKGRVCARTVIHCGDSKNEIRGAVEKALSKEFQMVCKESRNPYEGNKTSEKIFTTILVELNRGICVKKGFYDIEFTEMENETVNNL